MEISEYLIQILLAHSGYDIETIDRALSDRYVKDDIVTSRKLIAAYLGVSPWTLGQWRASGNLPDCVKTRPRNSNGYFWSAPRRELLRYAKDGQ